MYIVYYMLYISLVKYLGKRGLGIGACECEYERARGSETGSTSEHEMDEWMLLTNMKPLYKTPKVILHKGLYDR